MIPESFIITITETENFTISMTWRKKLYNFLEKPEGFFAKTVYFFIVGLILLSVSITAIEVKYWYLLGPYQDFIYELEKFITIVFTVEYILRFIASPKKKIFPFKPYNIVDLLAFLPFYLGSYHSGWIRILRILRIFKLMKSNAVRKAFKYKDSIFQKITPIFLALITLKFGIWFLERNDLWIREQSFGILFTIIGFALGIILSQKIGVAYQKYIEVDAAIMRIRSEMRSIALMLNANKRKKSRDLCSQWIESFLYSLKKDRRDLKEFELVNAKLYNHMRSDKTIHPEMLKVHSDLTHDAIFCLGKKFRPTPKAYDNLLHQATLVYLLLICLFTPGFNGVISVVMATYLLYGMYYVTVDFDYLFNKKFTLIKIETQELNNLLKEFQ